jgi:hypothetical protein
MTFTERLPRSKHVTLDRKFNEQFMRPEEFAERIGKSSATLYAGGVKEVVRQL